VNSTTDINRLLEKPCYIIDFLPRQVPKDCGGQFFKVEISKKTEIKPRLILPL